MLLSRYLSSNLVDDEFYTRASSFLRQFTSSYYPSSRSRVRSVSDNKIQIEVELAGYTRENIEVYEENGYLIVSAKDDSESAPKLYSNSWLLYDEFKVDKVKYLNGLLTVDVIKTIPPTPPRTTYKIE